MDKFDTAWLAAGNDFEQTTIVLAEDVSTNYLLVILDEDDTYCIARWFPSNEWGFKPLAVGIENVHDAMGKCRQLARAEMSTAY